MKPKAGLSPLTRKDILGLPGEVIKTEIISPEKPSIIEKVIEKVMSDERIQLEIQSQILPRILESWDGLNERLKNPGKVKKTGKIFIPGEGWRE